METTDASFDIDVQDVCTLPAADVRRIDHARKKSEDDPAAPDWIAELPTLLWRFADLGIIPDVGLMGLDELRGIYQFLTRLNDISGIEPSLNEPN